MKWLAADYDKEDQDEKKNLRGNLYFIIDADDGIFTCESTSDSTDIIEGVKAASTELNCSVVESFNAFLGSASEEAAPVVRCEKSKDGKETVIVSLE